MQTIVIAHNYTKDSYAGMSYYLANYLVGQGFNVVFISHRPYFYQEEIISKLTGRLTIISWPTKSRPTTLKDFIWFVKLYNKFKPEVIIGHFVGTNIPTIVSKVLSLGKVKTIVYYHTMYKAHFEDKGKSNFNYQLLVFRKIIFYRLFCNLIICPSHLAKEDIKQYYYIKKTKVLENPIINRYTGNTKERTEELVISYIGRLDPTKGVLEMLEAYSQYKATYPQSKIIIKIAGTGSLVDQLKTLILTRNDIIYVGNLNYLNIDEFIKGSHFVIIPSKFDNLPTVGIEALMNHVPLLISNSTGLTNYLSDGFDSFKFDSNIPSIINVFEKVERKDYDYLAMRHNAGKTYQMNFTVEDYCDKFLTVIEGLLKGKN